MPMGMGIWWVSKLRPLPNPQAPNRPVALFLFFGPTGVGKTELVKALAGFLFNDEQGELVNINMSELTEAARRKTYVRAEKLCISLSMKYGTLNPFGLTSNLGSNILGHSSSCRGLVTEEAKNLVMKHTMAPPELFNRPNQILVFNKLSRQAILDVVALRLKDVASWLRDRRIAFNINAEACNWLVEKGYSDIDGTCAVARVMHTHVLLRGTIRNDVVCITVSESDSLRTVTPPDSRIVLREGHD
ncbi:P-loop containing nucleoside triphosphate hydrolase protein [Suillus discolor]|uniref:P-loop containing nucleoside triphosphate hydrolase protein n=1 Tax=Suillus discolor TaxID=1912936 RepID=A0A9P7ESX7_9AGAM|nr:P-loop containing nucleoside triphosphate hydrolase protein [Suillus discolor]KAG2088932.1 P-loop containing nucleoside triphosphate hydrolase protein [Suillus discolor]